jgi:hypothetical protein
MLHSAFRSLKRAHGAARKLCREDALAEKAKTAQKTAISPDLQATNGSFKSRESTE